MPIGVQECKRRWWQELRGVGYVSRPCVPRPPPKTTSVARKSEPTPGGHVSLPNTLPRLPGLCRRPLPLPATSVRCEPVLAIERH